MGEGTNPIFILFLLVGTADDWIHKELTVTEAYRYMGFIT
jgi:hypothetical protein